MGSNGIREDDFDRKRKFHGLIIKVKIIRTHQSLTAFLCQILCYLEKCDTSCIFIADHLAHHHPDLFQIVLRVD